MRSVRRVRGLSERYRHGRLLSGTPGPVLSVSSLCARHIAAEALSFFNRHRWFSPQQLSCDPTHNASRSAPSVRKSSAPGRSGLPVLRRPAHGFRTVAAVQIQTRGCAPSRSSSTLAAMQLVSSSTVGSASHQAAQAHLRGQREPNHSVKRTAPGVPGSAAYLKRWAKHNA